MREVHLSSGVCQTFRQESGGCLALLARNSLRGGTQTSLQTFVAINPTVAVTFKPTAVTWWGARKKAGDGMEMDHPGSINVWIKFHGDPWNGFLGWNGTGSWQSNHWIPPWCCCGTHLSEKAIKANDTERPVVVIKQRKQAISGRK